MTARTTTITAPAASINTDTPGNMRHFLSKIAKHKNLILAFILLGMCGGFVITQNQDQTVTAQAILKISNPSLEQSQTLQNFNTLIQSEIETLKSSALLEVTKTDLDKNWKDDNVAGRPNALNFKGFSFNKNAAPASTDQTKTFNPFALNLHNLSNNLTIKNLKQSTLIKINYTHHNASYAKAFINTLVQHYITQKKNQIAQRYDATSKNLNEQIIQLENDIKALDKQILSLQSKHILKSPNTHNVEQIKALTTQIEALQRSSFELENLWENLKGDQGKSLRNQYLHLPDHLNFDKSTLSDLHKEKTRNEIKLFELLNIYGYKHPKIIKMRAKITGIKHAIDTENQALKTYIYDTIEQQKSLISTLKRQLGSIPNDRTFSQDYSLKIENLQRTKSLQTDLHTEMMNDLKKLKQQHINAQDPYFISSSHILPSKPFQSDSIFYGGLLGLLLSLLIITKKSRHKDTIMSAQHFKLMTQTSCVSLMPAVKIANNSATYITKNPTSHIAESVRNIKAYIHLQKTQGYDIKTLTIASALPNEGKSTISIWLAKLLAKSGKRVIVLDCDLRRPALHTLTQDKPKTSLVDYLSGHCELADAIVKDNDTGLHIIYGQAVPANALDLLTSSRMKNLITALKETYDFIIFDTPACLAASDAKILSQMSDLTLFAAQWHKTPISSALTAFNGLKMNSAKIATLLTHVDIAKHTRYGYGTTIEYYADI